MLLNFGHKERQDNRVIKFIPLKLFFALLILIFIAGCAGQVEEKQENPETTKSSIPPPPDKSLAPGTARIEAHLIEFRDLNNQINCIIEVDKVLQYGRSVKPIGKGTHLKLSISHDQDDLITILSERSLKQKYEFTVEQEELVNNPSAQSIWKALRIRQLNSD